MPGDRALSQQMESLELIEWSKYSRLVADAYAAAPIRDPAALPSFKAIGRDVERFFRMISSKVKVTFVDYDPYPSAEALRSEVRRDRELKVMTLHSDHPVFSEELNWKFRAVHDWFTHIIAGKDFSLKGEIAAYNTHTKMFSRDSLPALFTEVVGQVCYQTIRGRFPTQKVAVLPGFNYYRVGYVDGFQIKNKQLVPTQSAHLEGMKLKLLDRLEEPLLELGPEAKKPHKCPPTHRFMVKSRRCVPLTSMLTK